ncbi:MAG: carbohydrate-binding domain-containing protein [Bacteroidaceae bacterium]|nr:carbohydrate-binding domain-containing protein [Bacteroidaceae bacterium]
MRNRLFYLALMAVVAIVATCCSVEDDNSGYPSMTDMMGNNGQMPSGMGPGGMMPGGMDASDTSGSDLQDFDISLNSEALTSDNETIPTDENDESYEDYVEHSSFSKTVSIVYADDKATLSSLPDGVEATVDGAGVIINSTIKEVSYELKGSSSNGYFKIYSEKKFQLILNGVTLTNTSGAPINIQSGKRAFVTLADGTSNSLTDGSSYNTPEGEDEKGTLFSEGQLIFNGKGLLEVKGNKKNGIVSDDYIRFRAGTNIYVAASKGHGVKTNDYVAICGGVLNIEVSGTAKKGISTDGYVLVTGGRTTIITSGDAEYDEDENDVSGAAGIKADGYFQMDGGQLNIKSTGAGGKGINTDGDIIINDGDIQVITTGQTYTYNSDLDSKAKGIKSDTNVTVNGGTIKIKATGGEGSEGLEAKGVMNINGGEIEISTYDDCINSAGDMTISDGYIYAFATNNDAIDSNGDLYIKGGVIVALGSSGAECAIDAAEGKNLYISGGTVIGVGGSNASYPASSSSQMSTAFQASVSAGTTLTIAEGNNAIMSFTLKRSYQSGLFLVSSPNFKNGTSYTVYSGSSVNGDNWHGLYISPTVSQMGSQLGSVTAQATAGGRNMGGRP